MWITSFRPIWLLILLFLTFKPHSLPGSMMSASLETGINDWFLRKYIWMYFIHHSIWSTNRGFVADFLSYYLKRHETWINYFTSSSVAWNFLAFCWHSSLILIYSGFLDVSRKNPGYEDTNITTISDNWQLIGVMLESWFAISTFI